MGNILWDVFWFVSIFLLLECVIFGVGNTNDPGPK